MNAPESGLPRIWNAVIEKSSASGLEALSGPERTVLLVNAFLIDLENGGLSSALYNATGRLLAVSDAFAAVGDVRAATALREAAALLDVPNASRASTWSECLRVTTADRALPQWSRQLSDRVADLYEALETFTGSHLDELSRSTANDRAHR